MRRQSRGIRGALGRVSLRHQERTGDGEIDEQKATTVPDVFWADNPSWLDIATNNNTVHYLQCHLGERYHHLVNKQPNIKIFKDIRKNRVSCGFQLEPPTHWLIYQRKSKCCDSGIGRPKTTKRERGKYSSWQVSMSITYHIPITNWGNQVLHVMACL